MFDFARLVFALLFVVSLTTGCAEKHLFGDSTNYYMALQQNNIADEILFLEKIIEEKQAGVTDSVPPETYYFLVLLYSHNNNPAPDYGKAIMALDRYEELAPPQRNERLEIDYLRNILHEINQLAQLRKQHEFLKGEKTSLLNKCALLSQEIDTLNKENQTMKYHIDQLKMLDIRLEQKKRAIR
ncbi:MAG: hypothetical protein KKA54_03880 [Proteobacteria bacterium]|nr:hypothetical protein [Pseudomonadota bacterium]